MTSDRTILIAGVTSNQGGVVAKAPQGTGFKLRGLTRKPDSERAAALTRHGVDVVETLKVLSNAERSQLHGLLKNLGLFAAAIKLSH